MLPSPARAAAGAAALLALAVAAPLPAAGGAGAETPPSVLVEDWSTQPLGRRGIPEGWQGQRWGSPRYDLTVVADGNGRALHLRSDNEGSTISKEVKVDVKRFPILQWRWKAVVLPAGGDSRRKEADDQAAQIYVAFPRFPQAVRSRVIGYVWDTTAPVGLVAGSQKTGTVTYVIVRSGPAELGKWITETRNVLEDYRRIFGEEPTEEVGAISVAVDSNDTRSRAESFMGEILFRAR
jgi:hypothetical protein